MNLQTFLSLFRLLKHLALVGLLCLTPLVSWGNILCEEIFKSEKPSAHDQILTEPSKAYWAHAEKVFYKMENYNLRKNKKTFLDAQKKQDPFTLFLTSLKYQFKLTAKQTSMEEMINALNQKIDTVKIKYHLKEEQVLRPKFIFKNKSDDSFISLSYGENFPSEPSHWQMTGELSEKSFYYFLKNGIFPLGRININEIGRSHSTFFMHDLAHFSAFLEYPLMMQLARSLAYDLSKSANTGLSFRLGFVLEDAVVMKPSSIEPFKELLQLPEELFHKTDLHYSDIETFIKKWPHEERKKIESIIYENSLDWLEFIGAVARDVVVRKDNHPRPRQRTFIGRHLRLQSDDSSQNLAVAITELIYLSRMTPEEFILTALNKEVPVDSNIYHYFINSGVWPKAFARQFLE